MSIEQAVTAAAKQTARDMVVIAVLAFLAGFGAATLLGALS